MGQTGQRLVRDGTDGTETGQKWDSWGRNKSETGQRWDREVTVRIEISPRRDSWDSLVRDGTETVKRLSETGETGRLRDGTVEIAISVR